METIHEHLTGSIRKLMAGFGFIAGDDGIDYFFHWTAVKVGAKDFRLLVLQERVTCRIIKSPKGPRAIDVEAVIKEPLGDITNANDHRPGQAEQRT